MGIGLLSSVRSSVFRRSTRTLALSSCSRLLSSAGIPSYPADAPVGQASSCLGSIFPQIGYSRSFRHFPFRRFSSGVPAFQCSAVLRRSVFAAPAVTRPAAHRGVFGSPALYRSPHRRQLTTATSLRVHRVAHGSPVLVLSLHCRPAVSQHSPFRPRLTVICHSPHRLIRPHRCSLLLAARCRPYFPASQRTTACTSRFVRKPPCVALPILRPRKGIEPTRR